MQSRKIVRSTYFVLFLFFAMQACKKDDTTTPVYQHLKLQIHHKVGTENLEMNKVYTTASGTFSINRLEYYISSFKAENDNGDMIPFSGKYLLVSPSTEEYDLGEADTGSYQGFTFDIGVDSANNHKDPATFPSDHPLYIQSPSMNWTWNPGYKFMVIEGQVDTDNDSVPDAALVYHIGLDKYLTNVDLTGSKSYSISGDANTDIVLDLDVAALFAGINLANNTDTHTSDKEALAQSFVANIPGAFSVE